MALQWRLISQCTLSAVRSSLTITAKASSNVNNRWQYQCQTRSSSSQEQGSHRHPANVSIKAFIKDELGPKEEEHDLVQHEGKYFVVKFIVCFLTSS